MGDDKIGRVIAKPGNVVRVCATCHRALAVASAISISLMISDAPVIGDMAISAKEKGWADRVRRFLEAELKRADIT